ncbi:phosphatidylethanolamine-binding protein [Rhizobium sp. N113]|nr:phosphatidylethanolamine-binding protein [Rhizobium sp. N113]
MRCRDNGSFPASSTAGKQHASYNSSTSGRVRLWRHGRPSRNEAHFERSDIRQDHGRCAGLQQLRLHGQEHLAGTHLVGRSKGNQELRRDGLRSGSGWWHWSVFNIPANASKIATGASGDKKLPPGAVEGHTDFGTPGYGGACPPVGDAPHHYQFTVYALSVDKLPLPETAPGAMVGYYVRANTLDKASIEVTYGR